MIKFDRKELEHELSKLVGGGVNSPKESLNRFFGNADAVQLLEQQNYLDLFKLFSNRYSWASWMVNGVLLLSGIDTSEHVSEITNAFNCLPTTKIFIPNGVSEISDSAFYDNEFLRKVAIPKSVKTIGRNIFDSCQPGQITIIYGGTKEDWENVDKQNGWNMGYSPDGNSLESNICKKIMCSDDTITLP